MGIPNKASMDHITGRYIGIDYGMKRVGLARSDMQACIASPWCTCSPKDMWAHVRRAVADEQVVCIVVGMPHPTQEGTSHTLALVQSILAELHKAFPTVRVVGHDERYTSRMAQDVLVQGRFSRKKRQDKASLDAISAAILLDSYLQSQRGNSLTYDAVSVP